jgi:hypothetical protein
MSDVLVAARRMRLRNARNANLCHSSPRFRIPGSLGHGLLAEVMITAMLRSAKVSGKNEPARIAGGQRPVKYLALCIVLQGKAFRGISITAGRFLGKAIQTPQCFMLVSKFTIRFDSLP